MRRVRAGPEDALLRFDLLIGDTRVVGHPALRSPPQLSEHLGWLGKGEAAFPPQCFGNVLNDPPILPCVARAVNGFIDLDDAALGGCHRAFVFFVQRTGQDDVGVARRLVEEKINRHVEVELFQLRPHIIVVRQRDHRIEAETQQPFDLAALDLAEDLIGIHARLGQFIRCHAPDSRNVGAMFGIRQVATAG